ncbi:hypothetical protein H8356DRAFT_1332709 [Neocallimastix lanati (nom. inval.)]|nr:hypothetical protein H8356DRAFT_1332709 [Neocallimastix sp. JGI-2020a]
MEIQVILWVKWKFDGDIKEMIQVIIHSLQQKYNIFIIHIKLSNIYLVKAPKSSCSH